MSAMKQIIREYPLDINLQFLKLLKRNIYSVCDRLQGIVGSMSRMPTFRRRFQNLVKVLCIEAIQTGVLANDMGERLKTRCGGKSFPGGGNGKSKDATAEISEHYADDGNIV